MSAAEETTYTWSCDLCGSSHGTSTSQFDRPETLTRIEIQHKRRHTLSAAFDQITSADLCGDCLRKPIADLVEYVKAAS